MNQLLADVPIGEELMLNKTKGVSSVFNNLSSLINVILPNVYILSSLILFFLLIGGGIMVVINAGSDNPEGAAKGKKAITAALVGFLIIFASYWILQIVETITGFDIFMPGPL